MKVSVVVPAYNSAATLRTLLESLGDVRADGHEVIVVDDGSTDDSAEVGGSMGARVIRFERNRGPAAARNAGIEAAEGEIVMFLDADVRARPGLVAHAAERLAAEPELLAVNGYYSPFPVNPGFAQSFKARYIHYLFQGKSDTQVLETCCAAVRKKALIEAGGFDESYRGADVEDYELGYRLAALGPMKIDHELLVDHHFPGFVGNAAKFFRRSAMWTALLLKRRRFDQAATTPSEGMAQILGALAAAALAACFLAPRLFAPVFLLSFAAYLYWSRGFFRYLYQEEGAGFAFKGMLAHWANSVVISAGAAWGLLGYAMPKPRGDK